MRQEKESKEVGWASHIFLWEPGTLAIAHSEVIAASFSSWLTAETGSPYRLDALERSLPRGGYVSGKDDFTAVEGQSGSSRLVVDINDWRMVGGMSRRRQSFHWEGNHWGRWSCPKWKLPPRRRLAANINNKNKL